MEVKRTKTDQGFIKYVVFDNNHKVINSDRIKITPPHEAGSISSFWLIKIPDLSLPTPYGGFAPRAIYYSRTLEGIKEVLSRFSTEEELFGAYYKSRLAGKTQLF